MWRWPLKSKPQPGPGAEPRALEGYLAIALVACALLLYEIAITRVLSVVLWYHFAFLSISLAMLGVGASGVWFAARPPGPRALQFSLLAAAASLPLSVIAILRLRPAVLATGLGEPIGIVLIVIAMLVPMVALGSAICILLIRARGRSIGRMYGADLLGAMLGALLAAPLLQIVPTPQLIAVLGLLPLAALIASTRRVPAGAWIIAVGLIAAIAWREPFAVVWNKSYNEQALRPLYARWTPTARITLFDHGWWPERSSSPCRCSTPPWGWLSSGGLPSRWRCCCPPAGQWDSRFPQA